jgi:YD repeat-containing protein
MKTKSLARLAVPVLITLVISISAIAQERGLTAETILTIRTVVDAQLSPDGDRIIYQLSRARTQDEKPGAAISELWMAPTRGGEPYRFTYNERSDRVAQWSPDGKQIAFLSQRGDSAITQIFVIPANGGEAMQLTRAEISVQTFKWSPDGKRIAYTMADGKTKEESQAEKEGKDWIVADQNYKHTRLYVIDVKTRESKPATSATLTVHDFDWSPDGTQFILAATDTPLTDDSYMKVKLVTVNRAGEARLLVPTQGKLQSPCWSPDGKWIAWLGAIELKDSFAGSVFVVPAGGGTPKNLTPGYEGTATSLAWLPGAAPTLVFTVIERQANAIHTLSLSDEKRTPLFTQPVIYGSPPSFSRDGKWMAISANTPRHPNEVFFGEAANKPMNRLTRTNPQLDGVALGEQEVIKWKSVDGWEIEGVLVKPVGYQRGTRYPTVLQAHGGPEGADLNGWLGSYSRWGQMLAGKGFATLYANYRGSIGRGPQFAMADHRDLMGKEFQDMLAGIDHLVKQGITDPDRVGVGGGSYGGYTAAWATTYASDRFKAAVAWMGISNWYSMTGTSDIFWENSTVHWNATMYDNFDLYWERSPIAHIKKAKTATLIIHGAADNRVPIGQSQELYTALKWKGVPVEFVTYPREGHGVGERAHQLDYMKRVLGWYEKYLNGGTVQ